MNKGSIRITSLLNLCMAILFLIASVVTVIFVHRNGRQQALTEAEEKMRIVLDRNLATHSYFTDQMRPAINYLAARAAKPDYFDPVYMSSTYAVREIDNLFQELSDESYYYKEAAVNARSPENEADPFELDFISQINSDPDIITETTVRSLNGEPYFVLLRRGETMQESCLDCHGDPANAPEAITRQYGRSRSFYRNVGEVISTISVRIPLQAAYARNTQLSVKLSLLLLSAILFSYLIQLVLFNRLLFAPLAGLRIQAFAISSGKQDLGSMVRIPFGRELRELAQSFNHMSRELRASRDELEDRIERRTQELTQANERLAKEIAFHERVEPELMRIHRLESLGVLAGGIAHDFNNLLGAIMGNASLIKIIDDPQEHQECLNEIEVACHRARALSDQLLTFAKGGSPVKKQVDIGKLARESVALTLRGTSTGQQIDIPDNTWAIYGDEDQLHQVIHNVTINAVQAMEGHGSVKVTCSNVQIGLDSGIPLNNGPYVRLLINDSGPGIKNENLEKIFDPYFTTKDAGSGLGLATAHSIIQNHDGYIAISSSSGTEVSIYLPASPDILLEDVEEPPQKVEIPGEMNVLILDDEKAIRTLLQRALTANGFSVAMAETGEQAVELFRAAFQMGRKFDIMLFDLTIPGGMGGKEAFQEIKRIDSAARAYISSGYSDDPAMSDFRDLGFTGMVRKPYSVQDLIALFSSHSTNAEAARDT